MTDMPPVEDEVLKVIETLVIVVLKYLYRRLWLIRRTFLRSAHILVSAYELDVLDWGILRK